MKLSISHKNLQSCIMSLVLCICNSWLIDSCSCKGPTIIHTDRHNFVEFQGQSTDQKPAWDVTLRNYVAVMRKIAYTDHRRPPICCGTGRGCSVTELIVFLGGHTGHFGRFVNKAFTRCSVTDNPCGGEQR